MLDHRPVLGIGIEPKLANENGHLASGGGRSLMRALVGSLPETGITQERLRILPFYSKLRSSLGPVSYTHLTLPTNREV